MDRESSFIQMRLLVVVGALCLSTLGLLAAPVPTGKPGAYPAWWFTREVIKRTDTSVTSPAWPVNYPTSDDYAVINQGQLKNFATQAYQELQAQAPSSVWSTAQGTALSSLITGWNPASGDAYAVVNLGQLKTVAKPFYDVLIQIGYAGAYPWTGTGADDYATANIGQAKNTFSFDVGLDSDGNGLPDWWEIKYFGQLGLNKTALAPNGSGLTYLQCYQQETDPRQAAPVKPFNISVSATGPYQAPANPLVVTSVHHPATTSIAHVDFYLGTATTSTSGQTTYQFGGSASLSATSAPYQYQINSNLAAGIYEVKAIAYDNTGASISATTQFQVTEANRYNRGWGTDTTYLSSIIAVDMEKGAFLDNAQGSDPNQSFINLYPTSVYPLYPWFLRTVGETNELWQHIASLAISSVNNSTGILTTSALSHGLIVGQQITISGETGETAINGTFLVGTVPATNQFTLKTLGGGTVTLTGTYAGHGAVTSATFNILPKANGTTVGGEPPLVAFGSQGGNTPLYSNQSYNFALAAGGQVVFTPLTITSVSSANPSIFTVSSTSGLHAGQTIVISGATGSTSVNGTFIISTINSGTTFTLKSPPTPAANSGTAVSGITGYTASSATLNNADIKIEVYQASDFASGTKVYPAYTQGITVPRSTNATVWATFLLNGGLQDNHISATYNSKTIDFDTQVQLVPGTVTSDTWGQTVNSPLMLTHRAANSLFYYKVSYMGVTTPVSNALTVSPVSSDKPMGVDSAGINQIYNASYTLDFQDPSPWQSSFLSQPQFQGIPLPSAYQGKSVDELINNAPAVTDTLSAPDATGVVSGLNFKLAGSNSPELRDHPVLDKFVASMNNDPMALANYVLNQIDLTDAVGYNTTSSGVANQSINPQGVSRDALATYLEGQGSPAEQDALLIYLLRQAGYAAGYVFPAQNGTLMFDEQLSKLLRMQLRGASGPNENYNVPELIPVNYPWVAAYIPVNGTYKWIHIFPWLKDTSVTEGANLWSYLPTTSSTTGQNYGYQTGALWLQHYLLDDPAIRGLSTEDNPSNLFPLFVQNALNGTGVTMSQLGMTIYNRQNYYTSWDQFPRPWQTPTIANANLANNLDSAQNPGIPALVNIFDQIEVQAFSDRNGNGTLDAGEPVIDTGKMRLADLHDRRFLLYHQYVTGSQYNMILSLEPYSSASTGQGTFLSNSTVTNTYNGTASTDSGSLLNKQIANVALGSGDDHLEYVITYYRHQQALSLSGDDHWTPFLGLTENTVTDTRPLRKGDMACLCLDYGRVSQKMLEFQAEKFWDYQQSLSPTATTADPELSEGQLLYLMGMTYYNKASTFQQNVENWTKTHAVSWLAHGLTKLGPLRNSDDTPNIVTVNGTSDINLRYPKVDMAFQRATWVGNSTSHPDSGDEEGLSENGAVELMIGELSADEHRTINQFFAQNAAISTVKLLDVSQAGTGVGQSAPGIIAMTSTNYTDSSHGGRSYTMPKTYFSGSSTNTLQGWATQAGLWSSVTSAFAANNPNANATTIYMTPGPITAPGQAQAGKGPAYTGMGAFIFGQFVPQFYSATQTTVPFGALISDNMVINGGDGGDLGFSLYSYSPPASQVFNSYLAPTPDNGFTYTNLSLYSAGAPSYTGSSYSTSDFGSIDNGVSSSAQFFTPDQVNNLNAFDQQVSIAPPTPLSDTGTSVASVNSQMIDLGNIGTQVDYSNMIPGNSLGDQIGRLLTPDDPALRDAFGQMPTLNDILDPVNSITGEFYIDAVDIRLNGPMPIEIRRSYGSFNQSDNNFGQGWRMSYFPYLQFSSDSTTNPTYIYAAELDGSVIKYYNQTTGGTHWIVRAQDNPQMANLVGGSPGGISNRFNNVIDLTSTGNYSLTASNGSVRKFLVEAFPLTSKTASGSTTVQRSRPYLQSWTDNLGNFYTFGFGTTSTATDYGLLNRITSSNGNYLGFDYDTFGHIVDAYSGDGRRLYYQYDTYGDLVQVTLPDASTINYAYQHATAAASTGTPVAGNGTYSATPTQGILTSDNGLAITSATNANPSVITTASAHSLVAGQTVTITNACGNTAINGTFTVGTANLTSTTFTLISGAAPASTYSTHLISQETKPEGRIVKNDYDNGTYDSAHSYYNRRVVKQYAAVGPNGTVVQNAGFQYVGPAGSGNPSDNGDGTYNGKSIVTVINGTHSYNTTYSYDHSQITSILDPLGYTISQSWYQPTDSGSPGYRCLKTKTDKRGLVTTYAYDGRGNATTITLTGDVTGSGNTSDTAVTQIAYNNATSVTLPGGGSIIPDTVASVKDPVNNSTGYTYGNPAYPYAATVITKLVGTTTVSTTQLQYANVSGGGNSAYGLLTQSTAAAGSPDQSTTQYTYNSNGFLTSSTALTGTNDPAVVTTYAYDLRGEMTSETDAAGQSTKYSYDARGNRTGAERYDQWGNLQSWNFTYYNQNGEVQWEQGPRYSPNDYIYKQYDAGGRQSQEIKWLSTALVDGSGVTGGGYATTLFQHDAFGNLTEVDDPNQNATVMTYDAIGEMLTRTVHSGSNSGAVVANESFHYESGGQLSQHVDMLGGTENRTYTATGLLKVDTMPDNTTKTYLYDKTGRVAKETLTNGSYWMTSYNDAALTITHTFYNSGGSQLMQESQAFDRRGNLVSKTDVSGNTFATTYDGLNRIKSTYGPPTAGSTQQQTAFHVYDAAGLMHTVTNGAGERTNTYFDAEGRPTLITVFNGNNSASPGSVASNTGFWYSPDHQSVVKTVGSGANAITTTTWTDTRGNVVLLKHADGKWQGTTYDANGNRTGFQDEVGAATTWTYDALNRVLNQTLPGGAATNFTYTLNSPGETVLRAMSTGVTGQSVTQKTQYDGAGRKTEAELDGTDGSFTRKYTYSYYTSASPDYGLLYQVGDPRGFTTTTTYDAWLRPSTVTSSGSGATAQSTTYGYDNRGMFSSVTQSFTGGSTVGASTEVTRGYDAYGQISSECVYVDPSDGTTNFNSGTLVSQWAQSWDNTGRRSALNFGLTAEGSGAANYTYQYNANGLLTQVGIDSGTYSYVYGDNSLLRSRTLPLLTSTITARDNRGRITAENVQGLGHTLLSETLTWRDDDRVNTYADTGVAVQGESRTYGYDARNRVISEPYYNPTSLADLSVGAQTATYGFDQTTVNGTSLLNGLGVRTEQEANANTGYVSTTQNVFKQPTQETYATGTGTNLAAGFAYDAAGNVTTRSLSGPVNQVLGWDAFNHLVSVTARDSSNNGYNWTTTYDGLGRRVQSSYRSVTSGTPSSAVNLTYYYDPQVEFLELGILNGSRQWKVYGPDRNGLYGGQQGCGGLDGYVTETTGGIFSSINNFFGDSVGQTTSTTGGGFVLPLGGYGIMPGSAAYLQPIVPMWRGRYADWTMVSFGGGLTYPGFVYMGARYYDPLSGRFLSADPLGQDASLSLYDYCNGDPVNGYDPDGRVATGFAAGFGLGAFYQPQNGYQALGAGLGMMVSYAVPGIGEIAMTRDTAGGFYNTAGAVEDIATKGLTGETAVEFGTSLLSSIPGEGPVGAMDKEFAAAARFDETLTADASDLVTITENAGPGGFCFVAGTPVATEAGKEPIEKVKAGDRVWATDPQTHQSGYHQVTRTFVHDSDDLVDVVTSGRDKIECTPTHPFWVQTKGWIAAKSLFPGEQLLQRDGTTTTVFNVIPRHAPKTHVYNFEVEGLHTYYVGPHGLLVHNSCMAGGEDFGGTFGKEEQKALEAAEGGESVVSDSFEKEEEKDLAAAETAGSEGEEMVTVYRGVSSDHLGYQDALEGRANPIGGSATPAEHNAGDTYSEFTSWTTEESVARKFATTSTEDMLERTNGVVLKDQVPASQLIRAPYPVDASEKEVLRRGPVSGAEVRPQFKPTE